MVPEHRSRPTPRSTAARIERRPPDHTSSLGMGPARARAAAESLPTRRTLAFALAFLTLLLGGLPGPSRGAAATAPPAETEGDTPPAETGAAPPSVFFEEIEVEIAEVEVIVTDEEGRPVGGLTREDFLVRVDGRPVEVENFYAAERGAATAPTAPSAPGEDAELLPGAAADRETSVDSRLQLAVVVDLASLPMGGERRQAIESIASRLADGGRAGDQVLVAALGSRVEVVQPFTTDWQEAAAAVRRLGEERATLDSAAAQRRAILRELTQVSVPINSGVGGLILDRSLEIAQSDARRLLTSIDVYASQQEMEIRRTLGALETLIDRLGGLVGRKAVLLISGGVEDRPGQALMTAWQTKFSDPAFQMGVNATTALQQLDSLSSLFRDLATAANAKQVTFYATSTGSAEPFSNISAENPGTINPSGGSSFDAAFETTLRTELAAPLLTLAGATGGALQASNTGYGNLVDRLMADSESYYSLGFRLPGSEKPGHRVKVEVDRPGVRVRHRATVRPRSAEEKAAAATLARLVHESGENPLGLSLDLGVGEAAEDGLRLLPVNVRFPLLNVVLLPQQEVHVGELALFVVVMDEEGDLSSTQTVEIPIRIPTPDLLEALKRMAEYRLTLKIRPGWHRIAVGIHDSIGNISSTVTTEHVVSSADAG